MNDEPVTSTPPEPIPPAPSVETVAQQAVERAEAAATRRRWITLAEVVGIAGLLIAAASLWMSWSDHRADQQEKQVEKASEAKVRTLVLLTAKPEKDGKQLALKDSAHEVQSIDVRFPASLGLAAQSSVLEPRIEASWFADPILALTHDGPDKRQGRMPVLITSSYWDADQQRSDSAIYDVVWFTEGSFMGVSGRSVRLKGILLRERTASPARLEAIWAAEKPKPAG
ncbi:hypothetical protein GCM10009087_26650 [Sphingomonas oligophenolica]|uniref:Uncharacterized protein n=1 Tax=Sphingomonas oligophenolica TaxID=301154 RepID=A0ABU9YCT7_9SPHN